MVGRTGTVRSGHFDRMDEEAAKDLATAIRPASRSPFGVGLLPEAFGYIG
jgi:hypothetical protein